MEDMGMNRDFWKGRSVFLTGHTGFKGGWLALMLQQAGARVSGYALPPAHQPGIFTSARVAEGMVSTLADVRDGQALAWAMADAAPEIVLHLAAQPLVRASYANPVETYEVNVMGTVHFLEAVRRTPSVKVALVITSDKCYDNRELMRGYRENDPMGGRDPYSSSKGCAELVAASYRHSFLTEQGVFLATARAGNVIGGGDWSEDRLIPDMVRAWSGRQSIRIRYPQAIRPWQHVLEALNGYLLLAENLWARGDACADGWNFGPPETDVWTVGDMVQLGRDIWGEGASWQTDHETHPHEARTLKLDCTKAMTHLGWKPLLDVNTALEWTLSWYRYQQGGDEDMRSFSLDQIRHYAGLGKPLSETDRVCMGGSD